MGYGPVASVFKLSTPGNTTNSIINALSVFILTIKMLLYYYVFKNLPTKKQGFIRVMATIQGAYFFITGIWPIVDIKSFQLVTGPKTDLWLVKMVGLLTVAISLLLFVIAKRRLITTESIVLILGSSISYLSIDVYYSLNRVISYIYLADAVLQLIIILIWVQWLFRIRFKLRSINN